jgi:hypothetical protein
MDRKAPWEKERDVKIENSKIKYRRASINDVQTLIDYRVRFLNELYDHAENDDTQILKKSLQQYFSEAILSGSFIAWLAEQDGKTIGTGGMVVWQMPGRYEGQETGRLGYILNIHGSRSTRKGSLHTIATRIDKGSQITRAKILAPSRI